MDSCSCIYGLISLSNPSHVYVGQTVNLLVRIANHMNKATLAANRNRNMPISRAMLKYGPTGFALVIFAYLPKAGLDEAEKSLIARLQPYYNVSPGGSTSIGVSHTEATKALLRAQRLGTKHTAETKARISESNRGDKNAFHARTHDEKSLLLISTNRSEGPVYVYSAFNVLLLVATSIKSLAQYVASNFSTLKGYVNTGVLFRGGWYLTTTPKDYVSLPMISDPRGKDAMSEYDMMRRDVTLRKPVFVFEAETKAFVARHDTVVGCAKALRCGHETITAAAKVNGQVKDYIISFHRVIT